MFALAISSACNRHCFASLSAQWSALMLTVHLNPMLAWHTTSGQPKPEFIPDALVVPRFPSCLPPLDALLDALPALAPRMYSIASSPLAQPHAVRYRLHARI